MLFPVVLFGDDIKQIRAEFYEAVNKEAAAEGFYKKMKAADLNNPLMLAYYGSASALRAKHAWNPYHKVSYLKAGMKDIDKAVAEKPEHLEIRFLRFSLEHYLPAFLGYSKHLETDRKKIIALIEKNQLSTVDKSLLTHIIGFMKESGRCSPAEIAALKKAG